MPQEILDEWEFYNVFLVYSSIDFGRDQRIGNMSRPDAKVKKLVRLSSKEAWFLSVLKTSSPQVSHKFSIHCLVKRSRCEISTPVMIITVSISKKVARESGG